MPTKILKVHHAHQLNRIVWYTIEDAAVFDFHRWDK